MLIDIVLFLSLSSPLPQPSKAPDLPLFIPNLPASLATTKFSSQGKLENTRRNSESSFRSTEKPNDCNNSLNNNKPESTNKNKPNNREKRPQASCTCIRRAGQVSGRV